MNGTVTIPKQLLTTLVEAQNTWEKFSNELEDFLLSKDRVFIAKMKKARAHHRQGKTEDWVMLKDLR